MYIGLRLPDSRYHLTLTFNGHEEDVVQYKQAVRAAAAAAATAVPFLVEAEGGMSTFGPTNRWWAAPIKPAASLISLRDSLCICLRQYGVTYSEEFEYRPHITLTKFSKPKSLPAELTQPINFDRLHVVSNEFGTSEIRL